MATPADKDQPETLRKAPPTNEDSAVERPLPGSPITDAEYTELGRSMGMLVHRMLRARQENDGGSTAVLAMLSKCGPVRASELAKELFLDLSTVSRHVQHLERDGLVERAPDPHDRRATTLTLTGLGEKHIADVFQRRIDAMREGLGDWDPEDMRTLMRLLSRYAEDFSAIIGRNSPGHDQQQ